VVDPVRARATAQNADEVKKYFMVKKAKGDLP
jgi:hypothetical protein